jgi:negative regulator of flagellin synthesis FlgM
MEIPVVQGLASPPYVDETDMSNDIKGLGNPNNGINQTNVDRRATARTSEQSNAAPQQIAKEQANDVSRQATSVVRNDVVELSKGAQTLKNVNEKLKSQPEVNDKRVADIKAALESGEYQINDVVVADKLLQIDDLFE